jgi:RNA polymerase sigma factor (sigma-70 family)
MDRLTTWMASNLRWLKGQLRRRGRTTEEAEDLIQEAWLRVFEYCERGQVREPERVLVRTVSNLMRNEDRHRRRHPYVGQAVEELSLADAAPLPEEVLASRQRLTHVLNALATVDTRTREAFLLHRTDGLSYPQIAKQLGVSVSTVEKRIAWAMAVLLDATARHGEES